jgi:hypothetical protein
MGVMNTYMNRLFLIISDTGLVLIALLTKLMPPRMRDSILDWVMPPVRISPFHHNKGANGTVHRTEKIN